MFAAVLATLILSLIMEYAEYAYTDTTGEDKISLEILNDVFYGLNETLTLTLTLSLTLSLTLTLALALTPNQVPLEALP